MVVKSKPTAKDLEQAIFAKYTGAQSHWIVLREVTMDDDELVEQLVAEATAAGKLRPWALEDPRRARKSVSYGSAKPVRRRIDVLLVSHKNSKSAKIPRERIALEIKVSRADFLSETDEKRGPWRRFADKFAYVAPAGMIKPEELPAGCGLIEWTPSCWREIGDLTWKVLAKADPTKDRRLSENFGHYLLTRLHNAEVKLRAKG